MIPLQAFDGRALFILFFFIAFIFWVIITMGRHR